MSINFLKIWNDVKDFFIKLLPHVHDMLVTANDVLTRFKTWETTTPLGQFVTNEIEPLIPGLGIALQNFLPEVFIALKWAIAETSKTPDQIVQEGFAYLKSITDPDIKAVQHNAAAALIGKFITSNNGAGLTIQQHIVAPQAIYNPAAFQQAA
jgi:hypothetical protein